MKVFHYIAAFLLLLTYSCTTEVGSERANQKSYAIEFVNRDSSDWSREVLSTVNVDLLRKGYVFAGSGGVVAVDTNDVIGKYGRAGDEVEVHRFIKFAETATVNDTIEKIVVTFDSSVEDSLQVVSIRSYRKQGYAEWQSVKNPGSFSFSSTQTGSRDEIDWLRDLIVRLTFK